MNYIIEQLNRKIAAENPIYGEDGIDGILEMLTSTTLKPIQSIVKRLGMALGR